MCASTPVHMRDFEARFELAGPRQADRLNPVLHIWQAERVALVVLKFQRAAARSGSVPVQGRRSGPMFVARLHNRFALLSGTKSGVVAG
jgi:hypothetical protein